MSSIAYTKMSGAGNTFLMIDGRTLPAGADLPGAVPGLCVATLEHGGVDGVIVVDAAEEGDFLMRYYNRDGSTGMMCGNGGRCAVAFAEAIGVLGDRAAVTFSNAGVGYRAAMTDRGVKVWFPEPRRWELGIPIELVGLPHHVHFVDVGTPHAVIFLDEMPRPHASSLATLEIEIWGPPLRHHVRFQPNGANANFVEVRDDRSGINLRTFERGVEAETGACGTGALSSAIVASLRRGLEPPVAVTVTSGATLWVDFRREGERIVDLSLEGNAEVVMTGRIEIGD